MATVRWFDTSAFAVAPRYPLGNAGRNILRGDGYASVDLALVRRIPLGGSRSLWVEARVFSLFNHVNCDLPELYADEPATFGRVFSANAARPAQVAWRCYF